MRKIVNVTHVSLDGVMERMEDWHFDYVGDSDMGDFFGGTLRGCDLLVLGRRTYEGFAATSPQETGEIADKLNTMTKLVASTTLRDPAWTNTTVISGGVAAELARREAEAGGDIITYGWGPIAHALAEGGLMDEIHIGINATMAG
ncbi:dihydrofolate reductase family protein [Jiangella alba]|uniref:Dihydrofolate reductase n=1 Tax=Jiangella alba TaxID=561176 RepID=A0A1H5JHP2_9ACTN|nr:dihydrofolate reductase family protein [Jiangella alba]SEE51178.1 Dihydrofolate reductase [Jiangella alba]